MWWRVHIGLPLNEGGDCTIQWNRAVAWNGNMPGEFVATHGYYDSKRFSGGGNAGIDVRRADNPGGKAWQ